MHQYTVTQHQLGMAAETSATDVNFRQKNSVSQFGVPANKQMAGRQHSSANRSAAAKYPNATA